MIKYNDSDWVKLENEAQLSEGDLYIVYGFKGDIMCGVMEYDEGKLWGDEFTITISPTNELLSHRQYWIMPFEYPEPPDRCFKDD